MRFLNIIFVLTFLTVLSNAKEHSTCREPVVFSNIELMRLSGHWYQYARYRHQFGEGCKCSNVELIPIDENSLQILTCCQMTRISNVTQNCEMGPNKMTLTKPETKEAMFKYTIVGSTVESSSWIIDTDYNYVIVSGCDLTTHDEKRDIFFIFTREKELKENEKKKIRDILKVHNFDRNKIMKETHEQEVCTAERPQHPPITKLL